MKLMMVCPACEGIKNVIVQSNAQVRGVKKCTKCKGEGYINPPQQILDDLECAEIERELEKNVFEYSYKYDSIYKDHTIRFRIAKNHFICLGFSDETKLEALRKAKAWLDGRCVE